MFVCFVLMDSISIFGLWRMSTVDKPYQKNNNNLVIIVKEGQQQNRVNSRLKEHYYSYLFVSLFQWTTEYKKSISIFGLWRMSAVDKPYQKNNNNLVLLARKARRNLGWICFLREFFHVYRRKLLALVSCTCTFKRYYILNCM